MAGNRAKGKVAGLFGKIAIPFITGGWTVYLAASSAAPLLHLSESATKTVGAGLFLFGLVCGAFWIVAACVSAWRDSRQDVIDAVQEFNTALGRVQSNLASDWAAKARIAIWPPLLTPKYQGGAANWVKRGAGLLEGTPEGDVLAVARAAYRPHNSINEEWHLKHRLRMRKAADRLGELSQSKNPFVRRLLRSRINREGVIMCGYLEAALAERLSMDGRTADIITEWAELGEGCPALSKRPPTTHAVPTLSRIDEVTTFDEQISRLNPEQHAALRVLVRQTYVDVEDSETSALRDVEQQTDFLVRSPKHNTVTRYRLNAAWSVMLNRWAALSAAPPPVAGSEMA